MRTLEFCPPPIIRVERFAQCDLEMAANDIILAMDGNIRRDDALLCARAAFESKGMEFQRAALRAQAANPRRKEG